MPRPLAPVAGVYCLFIGTMAATAALGAYQLRSVAGFLLLFGMAFFLASDSVLAINVFKRGSQTPVQNGIIMVTYIAAQALLCDGFSMI